MDPQSPPKRMTRARAAAKVEPTTKPTRVVSAAAKTKATRTATTTATKRKIRSDDGDDSDNDDLDMAVTKKLPSAATKTTRATRGRAKKTVDELAPEPELTPEAAPAPRPRGRPRKVAIDVPAEEPVKPARAVRTRKAAVEQPAETTDVPKKATRGRPPSSMATRTATTKPTVKKTVKFEEPEKENIIPSEAVPKKTTGKASDSTSGLRAKPVRKAATATSRAIRGTKASSVTGEKPIPLSPKKVNQITLNRTDSDDELAPNESNPARPLRKKPTRPPLGSSKPAHETKPASGDIVLEPSELGPSIILGSPIRKAQSPWKGALNSPAKRVEGVLGASTSGALASNEPSASPFKVSLLQSPAKRQPTAFKGFELGSANGTQLSASPFKTSLLLSPAKRAPSPLKALAPKLMEEESPTHNLAPKAMLLVTPRLPVINGGMGDDEEDEAMVGDEADDEDGIPDSPTRLRFPGRLSAVLPRHADPVLAEAIPVLDSMEEGQEPEAEAEDIECAGDPMVLDEAQVDEIETIDVSTVIAAQSPPKSTGPMFRLREKDLRDYDSETEGVSMSEDELAPRRTLFPSVLGAPATPSLESSSRTPMTRITRSVTGSTSRNTAKRLRIDGKFGFTPLADQLSDWAAKPSPFKIGIQPVSPFVAPPIIPVPAAAEASPTPTTFFDEAMAGQPEPDALQAETQLQVPSPAEMATPVIEDIPFTDEDIALAAEANEMSLMESAQAEDLAGNRSFDDSISEASQEYGDENEVPVDPTLLGAQEPMVPAVTPRRPLQREFHTVSKVPLKPADDSTPQLKVRKQRHSVSRLPVARPGQGLTRSATVISYSPTKSRDENGFGECQENSRAGSVPPATPTKSEAGWSMAGTPTRTPRRDIDPALLKGAVVFVDVHTSEGADASGIFVELLTQMGARCVKSWPWNPSSPPGNDGASSKIGITHVVYKDGGKRTLEKVRESGGVVQCVGVSWVLE